LFGASAGVNNVDAFQPIILLSAPVILAAYVCRLSMLSFRAHRSIIILMHMANAMAVGWTGYRAWSGESQFGDLAVLMGAGCWILISYGSWKSGVPQHFNSRPNPLDTESWIKVHGGKRD